MSVRCLCSLLMGLFAVPLTAAEPAVDCAAAQRGYRNLTERAYLPPDFDQDVFDNAWQHWPEPLRSQAEKATPNERRKLAFARYGLTPRPDDPSKPLQYVVDQAGRWTMNCLACHGGTIPGGKAGTVVWPGAPNSRFALQTLTEETRLAKAVMGRPFTRMDVGGAFIPLGATNGTTNAVMFGVVLMGMRDAELNVEAQRSIPKMTHHDMDAPPWWHFRRKKMLYIDGFAEKGHRGLMQFMLVRSNGPEKFHGWEDDFRDVFAYISSIEPPKYPFAIDRDLAAAGEKAFVRVCAECHGTYGQDGQYPEKLVEIDAIQTDRVRLDALTPRHREAYGKSWFTHFGKLANLSQPGGYVAPPLDGIWASAPYLHNGSVPTLWHILHPQERPTVWRGTEGAFDARRVGPQLEAFDNLPAEVTAGWKKREYFDTRAFGKSASGHTFPEKLTEDDKRAVLEYLKTL